jgi:hypothetical protein
VRAGLCEGSICPPLTLTEPAVTKVAPIIAIVSVFIRVSKQPGVIVRLRRMSAQEVAGLSFGSLKANAKTAADPLRG